MQVRLLLVCAILSGCGSTMYKPSDMTAEQLKAMAADNKGVAYCMTAQNVAGNVRGTFANLDLVNKISGSVSIDQDCRMTITGSSTVTPAAAKAAVDAPTK